MPATFPAKISIFVHDKAAVAKHLKIDGVDSAVCFYGRNERGAQNAKLILSEDAVDEIEKAIKKIEIDECHPRSHASLKALKGDSLFFNEYEQRGIELPKDKATLSLKNESGSVLVAIVNNGDLEEGASLSGDQKKSAITINVTKLE